MRSETVNASTKISLIFNDTEIACATVRSPVVFVARLPRALANRIRPKRPH